MALAQQRPEPVRLFPASPHSGRNDLTRQAYIYDILPVEKKIPTAAAAEAVQIGLRTLQDWIQAGQVKAPRPIIRRGRAVRLWSPGALARLRQVKERIYRKGRGRKKKPR